MANPAFKKFKEAEGEISNNKYISFPIFGVGGDLMCTF